MDPFISYLCCSVNSGRILECAKLGGHCGYLWHSLLKGLFLSCLNWPGKDGGGELATARYLSTYNRALHVNCMKSCSVYFHLSSKPSLRLTMCLRGRETQSERDRQRDKSRGERKVWGWWTLSDWEKHCVKKWLGTPLLWIFVGRNSALLPGPCFSQDYFNYSFFLTCEWQINQVKGVFQPYLNASLLYLT